MKGEVSIFNPFDLSYKMLHLPPNPPTLGGFRTLQSPPELGDLGGETALNVSEDDLWIHRSLLRGNGFSGALQRTDINPVILQ